MIDDSFWLKGIHIKKKLKIKNLKKHFSKCFHKKKLSVIFVWDMKGQMSVNQCNHFNSINLVLFIILINHF